VQFGGVISKFSYLYTSKTLNLAKFGLQGLKSIDRLFIHCDFIAKWLRLDDLGEILHTRPLSDFKTMKQKCHTS